MDNRNFNSLHSFDPVLPFSVRARTMRTWLAAATLLSLSHYGQAAPAFAQQSAVLLPSPSGSQTGRGGRGAGGEQAAIPDFATIQFAVAQHFASLKDYQSGDLLSQSQIDRALDAVRDAGWDVPERKSVVERALSDGSFLAKALSTPAGKKFMRRVARNPSAYIRLDRMSTIAGGQALVRDLIRDPGGDKLLEYLATTPGGRRLGRMTSHTQRGVDLNKPTGRIYTADDLLAVLQKVYAASIGPRT